MLFPVAFILGAVLGWRRAVARGGDRLDQLQYAAVHAIIFVLLAVIILVLLERLGVV
jgi:hypothetical protein